MKGIVEKACPYCGARKGVTADGACKQCYAHIAESRHRDDYGDSARNRRDN